MEIDWKHRIIAAGIGLGTAIFADLSAWNNAPRDMDGKKPPFDIGTAWPRWLMGFITGVLGGQAQDSL